VLAAAAEAACAVFDRTLKLAAPNRVFVEEAVAAAAAVVAAVVGGRHEYLAAAADQARTLNKPMLDRLHGCAADTSDDWQGKIVLYPPEARELVALVDRLTAEPETSTDDDQLTPLDVRAEIMRRGLVDVFVSASTAPTLTEDLLRSIRSRAVNALAEALP
jgi:hypothetical protein